MRISFSMHSTEFPYGINPVRDLILYRVDPAHYDENLLKRLVSHSKCVGILVLQGRHRPDTDTVPYRKITADFPYRAALEIQGLPCPADVTGDIPGDD